MYLDQQTHNEVAEAFQLHIKDTKSADLQIGILTERIRLVTDEIHRRPIDRQLRMLLMQLVGKRRSLLNYLRETDSSRYRTLSTKIGMAQ
jgi:small subunit ribosomal protein S15